MSVAETQREVEVVTSEVRIVILRIDEDAELRVLRAEKRQTRGKPEGRKGVVGGNVKPFSCHGALDLLPCADDVFDRLCEHCRQLLPLRRP